MPTTGNTPAIIPMVTEKASFSGDNPFLGKSLKGIRILFLMDSKIFKVGNISSNYFSEDQYFIRKCKGNT